MIEACHLAGFFAAHAIWCVAEGETLTPILGTTTPEGERRMERHIVDDDLEASVASAQARLLANEMQASRAVMLFDGLITLESGKLDAIILEIRSYAAPGVEAKMAVPYTPAGPGAFRVHRPKVLAWPDPDHEHLEAAMESFWQGIAEHEQGSAVWNDALDESI